MLFLGSPHSCIQSLFIYLLFIFVCYDFECILLFDCVSYCCDCLLHVVLSLIHFIMVTCHFYIVICWVIVFVCVSVSVLLQLFLFVGGVVWAFPHFIRQ